MSPAAKKQTKSKTPAQLTPRERQRLAEKNKKRRIRRKRFVIFSFSFVVIALVTGVVYGFFTVFKITNYIVTGSKTYSAVQVYKSSGLKLGKNLFLVKIGSAEVQLESKLPYIGNVQIRRELPGTLKYVITETNAAAVLEYENGFLLLNSDGKILEQKAGKSTETLPLLKCPEPGNIEVGRTIEFTGADTGQTSSDILAIYKDLLAAIKASKINEITVIDMSEPTDVRLFYQNRLTLHIGTPTNLESKLALAADVINKENINYPNEKGEIDLTILKRADFLPTTKPEPATSAEPTTGG